MKLVRHDTIEGYQDVLRQSGLKCTDIVQTSKGIFSSQHLSFTLPHMQIIQRSTQASSLQYFQKSSNSTSLIFFTNCKEPIVNAKRLGQDAILFFSPRDNVFAQLPTDSEYSVCTFDTTLLNSYLPISAIDKTLSHSNQITSNNTRAGSRANYKYKLQNALLPFNNIKIKDNPVAQRDLQESMMLSMEKLFRDFELNWSKPPLISRKMYLEKAIDYTKNNPDHLINVSDLSLAACCTPRALEYAFRDLLGTTPQKYLIYRRMRLVHQKLKMANGKKFSRILHDFGITNTSRFSKDYLASFGERPQDTINKSNCVNSYSRF